MHLVRLILNRIQFKIKAKIHFIMLLDKITNKIKKINSHFCKINLKQVKVFKTIINLHRSNKSKFSHLDRTQASLTII